MGVFCRLVFSTITSTPGVLLCQLQYGSCNTLVKKFITNFPWSVDLSWFSRRSKITENPCPSTGMAMVSPTGTEVSGNPATCGGKASGGNWLGSPEPHSDG